MRGRLLTDAIPQLAECILTFRLQLFQGRRRT